MHTKNPGVDCSVHQCKYNEASKYCTLNVIKVGTHEQNPTVDECTDCQSFQMK